MHFLILHNIENLGSLDDLQTKSPTTISNSLLLIQILVFYAKSPIPFTGAKFLRQGCTATRAANPLSEPDRDTITENLENSGPGKDAREPQDAPQIGSLHLPVSVYWCVRFRRPAWGDTDTDWRCLSLALSFAVRSRSQPQQKCFGERRTASFPASTLQEYLVVGPVPLLVFGRWNITYL